MMPVTPTFHLKGDMLHIYVEGYKELIVSAQEQNPPVEESEVLRFSDTRLYTHAIDTNNQFVTIDNRGDAYAWGVIELNSHGERLSSPCE